MNNKDKLHKFLDNYPTHLYASDSRKTGPDELPMWYTTITVRVVRISQDHVGVGRGLTKKESLNDAAAVVLMRLRQEEPSALLVEFMNENELRRKDIWW